MGSCMPPATLFSARMFQKDDCQHLPSLKRPESRSYEVLRDLYSGLQHYS